MKLFIERLGPLRDTSVELGDVTILFGLPNAGKSYLLRAVYASHIYLDSFVFRWCADAKVIDELLGMRVEIEVAVPRVDVDKDVVYAERADMRVAYEALIEALRGAISRCVENALLPHGASYGLGGEATEAPRFELAVRLLPELFCSRAERLRLTRPGGCSASIENGVLRVRLSPVRVARERRLWALSRLSSSTANYYAVEAEYVLQMESLELEMVLRALLVDTLRRAVLRLAGGGHRIVYAAYGRSIVTQALLYTMLRPEKLLYPAIEEALGSRNLPALSLFGAITRGYRILVEDEEVRREVLRIFSVLLGGEVRLAPGSIEYISGGARVPLHFASALVGEVAGLMLASAPLVRNGGILLVEEPEAQLHPRMHVLLPIVFYALAARGVRVVLTTHSDILVSVAAALTVLADRGAERLREAVETLLEKFPLIEPPRETVEYLSSLLSERVPRMKIRFYYVGGGKARELEPREVLQGIPSMSEVLHELTQWYLGA